MTSAKLGTAFTAALLFVIGGASAETAGLENGETGKLAGEAQAHAYYAEHRAEFASHRPAITTQQREAALAQGRLQRQASSQQPLNDGGKWALPARVVIQLGDIK